jgi:hypothetical protein
MSMNTRFFVGKPPMTCWRALLCLLFLGLGWAMLPTATAHAAPRVVRPLSGMCDYALVQVATSANTLGYMTYIDYPPLNGHPTARLFVTQLWNPPGHLTGVYNDHPIGVWYDANQGKWTIFNEDFAAMPNQAGFSVNFNIGRCTALFDMTFTTGTGSLTGATAWIDSPLTNGHSELLLEVTQQWLGVYNTHPVGVVYNRVLGKWGVMNLDGATMPVSAIFNVAAVVPGAGFRFTTDSGNTSGSSSLIAPGTAPIWATPSGGGTSIDAHNIGLWYNVALSAWAVFNEGLEAMPLDANFTVKQI